jgi:hypothetical protein
LPQLGRQSIELFELGASELLPTRAERRIAIEAAQQRSHLLQCEPGALRETQQLDAPDRVGIVAAPTANTRRRR